MKRLGYVMCIVVGKAFNNCIHNLFKEKQIEVSDFSVFIKVCDVYSFGRTCGFHISV